MAKHPTVEARAGRGRRGSAKLEASVLRGAVTQRSRFRRENRADEEPRYGELKYLAVGTTTVRYGNTVYRYRCQSWGLLLAGIIYCVALLHVQYRYKTELLRTFSP